MKRPALRRDVLTEVLAHVLAFAIVLTGLAVVVEVIVWAWGR